MKKNLKKILILLPALFAVVFVSFCIYLSVLLSPVSAQKTASVINDTNAENSAVAAYYSGVRIEVSYGETAYDVANKLCSAGIIKNARLFYYFIRFPRAFSIFFKNEQIPASYALKSGVYYADSSMSFPQLAELFSSGKTEYVSVVIPEGYTISKIGALLEQNRICTAEDFISFCKTKKLPLEYGIPAESCEGYLFPDTYFLNIGMDAETVARVMIENFFEKIKSVSGLSEKNSEDLFQIVTLASIVEREYRVPEEAPLIASVFKNRIRRNIGLYSCATVEYIITEILGRPHPERIMVDDTRIDNPYNTYKWAGLTPGPISNPGLIALDAACNTPQTNYYFFQIADASAGKHVFTTTFEEHKVNHNLYTKK